MSLAWNMGRYRLGEAVVVILKVSWRERVNIWNTEREEERKLVVESE
jgi:hypothetical protein